MNKKYFLSSLFAAMFASTTASADVISMQTTAKVGDKLSIALNENVKATLTWGNGEKQDLLFDGSELEIEVKDASFTIETSQRVTRLYCPNCELTELGLEGAPNLTALTCSDNQLKTLNLNEAVDLLDLNCSGNQLENVILSGNKKLEYVNVSNNKLKSLGVASLTKLNTLLCANNALERLYLSLQKELNTLWCQNNKIDRIDFSSKAKLAQVCAFNNVLKDLKPEAISLVKELWLDNNKLTNLDLSTSEIEVLSASDNDLKLIKMNKAGKNALKAFYVDGNNLMYNSFPTVYKISTNDTLVSYNIDNQRPYELVESVNINENVNVEEQIRRNAWNDYARVKLVWKTADGKELVRNEDYRVHGSKYSFLKPYAAVIGEATSDIYPGAVLSFIPIKVIDPTGIGVVSDNTGLQVSVVANELQVSCSQSAFVKVYNVGGALVVNQQISAGTHRWILPAGIYVVNGKKVVIDR